MNNLESKLYIEHLKAYNLDYSHDKLSYLG